MVNPTKPYEAALDYCRRGWSVIPLCWPGHPPGYPACHRCAPGKDGKVPLGKWTEYQNTSANPAQIERWWRLYQAANVGVVMGKVSGLCAWDTDDEHGHRLLLELMGGDIPPTLTFRTGSGGTRYLFYWPTVDVPRPIHFPSRGKPLTFLGEGSQTVMPPSLHLTGYRYEWWEGAGPDDIPVAIAPTQMVKKIEDRHEAGRKTRGADGRFFAEGGFAEKTILAFRALAYCDKHPPSIEGRGGRNVAFRLACALVHGLGLTEAQAVQVMQEGWNARCEPPWSEAELRERVRSAANGGSFPRMDDTHANGEG